MDIQLLTNTEKVIKNVFKPSCNITISFLTIIITFLFFCVGDLSNYFRNEFMIKVNGTVCKKYIVNKNDDTFKRIIVKCEDNQLITINVYKKHYEKIGINDSINRYFCKSEIVDKDSNKNAENEFLTGFGIFVLAVITIVIVIVTFTIIDRCFSN